MLPLDSPYPAGTIALQRPFFRQLAWTPLHPPEPFSFWPCRLRPPDATGAGQPAWISWPHPETKEHHFQPSNRLEVLAAWIEGLVLGMALEPRTCLEAHVLEKALIPGADGEMELRKLQTQRSAVKAIEAETSEAGQLQSG